MRKLFLTVALAALLCVPAVAQFRGMGMGGDVGAMILANEGVQKELKLTSDQKDAIVKVAKARLEAFAKLREDMDREAFQTANEAATKAMAKVKDDLTAAQKKRLLGLEVQLADKNKTVTIFKNADVIKALALTEKQTDSVKELLTTYEADAKELFEETKEDRSKFFSTMQKVQKLGGATYDKIVKNLDEKQVATWKEIQGEKYAVDTLMPKGFGSKGKGKAKKDDN